MVVFLLKRLGFKKVFIQVGFRLSVATKAAMKENNRISIMRSRSTVYGEFVSESTISHNQASNLARPSSLVLHNEKICQPLALITTITLQVQNLKITSKVVMELAHTCSTDL